MKTGIIVFGHGSSVPSANEAVRVVASKAAQEGGWQLYETAFLECAPLLDEAVPRLTGAGAEEILIVPYFLTLGIHLQRDLPRIVGRLSQKHNVPIRVTDPLDGHAALTQILLDRVHGGL